MSLWCSCQRVSCPPFGIHTRKKHCFHPPLVEAPWGGTSFTEHIWSLRTRTDRGRCSRGHPRPRVPIQIRTAQILHIQICFPGLKSATTFVAKMLCIGFCGPRGTCAKSDKLPQATVVCKRMCPPRDSFTRLSNLYRTSPCVRCRHVRSNCRPSH